MAFYLNLDPSWVSAISNTVIALGSVGSLYWARQNFKIKFLKDNNEHSDNLEKEQDPYHDHNHKPNPFFSVDRFSLFRRSSMRKVSKKARSLSKRMKNDRFDPTLIFFIGRGGAIFGSLISYNLGNKPILCVDRQYIKHEVLSIIPIANMNIPTEYLERILIVAGEAHTGDTIEYFIKQFQALNISDIRTCVYYKQNCCKLNIDYIGRQGHDTVLMPWQDADFKRESMIKLE